MVGLLVDRLLVELGFAGGRPRQLETQPRLTLQPVSPSRIAPAGLSLVVFFVRQPEEGTVIMRSPLDRFVAGGLLALVMLAGDVALGSSFKDLSSPDKAVIYFYRPRAFYGSFVSAKVYIGANVRVGALRPKQYVAVVVEPGKHTLKASGYASSLEVTVGPGTTTYVEVEMFEAGATTAEARLVLPIQAEAAKKIKRFKFKGGVRILRNGEPTPL